MRKDVAAHPAWVDASIGAIVAPDGLFTDGDWVETKDQDPNGTVRLIQLADIGDGNFLDKSARFLTRAKAHALNCTFLTKGDLLVARLAEPLGRCCIFPLDGDEEYVTVVDVWRGPSRYFGDRPQIRHVRHQQCSHTSGH